MATTSRYNPEMGDVNKIGHGSFVQGPNAERQANWTAWNRLLARARQALEAA